MVFLTTSSGGMFTPLLFLGLMVVVFYFFIMRPQQKRNKERNKMLTNLAIGDNIVTIGGLNGTIEKLMDDKIVLKVNENTSLTFDKFAINHVVNAETGKAK